MKIHPLLTAPADLWPWTREAVWSASVSRIATVGLTLLLGATAALLLVSVLPLRGESVVRTWACLAGVSAFVHVARASEASTARRALLLVLAASAQFALAVVGASGAPLALAGSLGSGAVLTLFATRGIDGDWVQWASNVGAAFQLTAAMLMVM